MNNFDVKEECLINVDVSFEFFNSSFIRSRHDVLTNATLLQALHFFKLPYLLDLLDQDLDLVKNKTKSKEDHKKYFTENVNDKFKRLSTKHHPDRIKNRGGTEEDVSDANELQIAVNSIWRILQMLHENFINNNFLSDENFKYSTCSMVEISILSNEERLKNLNNKVLVELCWLSRIKHQKMIPNLNKFLEYSQSSLQSFIYENNYSFEQKKKQALILFNLYVSGYEELFNALVSLKENCERDNDLACIDSSVERMLLESKRNLRMLYTLKDFYKYQSRIFHRCIYPNADKELVQPFISYLDLIFKCSSVRRKTKELQRLRIKDNQSKVMELQIKEIKEKIKAKDTAHQYCLLHHLTIFYCKGVKRITTESLKNKFDINITINQTMAKFLFCEILKQYLHYVQNEFQYINIFYEHDIKAVKRDVEKILQDFTFSMREAAQKGQQEIRKMQNEMKEDFCRMQEEFLTDLQNAEDENERRINEMEHKLKQADETEKQVEQRLHNEIQRRTKFEVKLRGEFKRNSKMEDKLRRQSQNLDEEMEISILKKFQEISEMENEIKKNLEDIEF